MKQNGKMEHSKRKMENVRQQERMQKAKGGKEKANGKREIKTLDEKREKN